MLVAWFSQSRLREALGHCFAAKWIMTGMMIRNLLLTSALFCSMPASHAVAQSIRTIESSPLQEVGPWGAAALPLGLERLDSDLWQGADPGTLKLAFERIGPDLRFPALQRLVRQAVFSGGSAPAGDLDLARARFLAANRLGPSEAATRLFQTVPRLSADPALVNLAIDAAFRAGRADEACGWVASPGLEDANSMSTSSSWLETRATCYALNGEAAAANLSVDLARGKGQTDTWLGRAVAAASGPVTNPPPFRADSGRALVLSMKAQLKLPKSLASNGDPSALSALISWPDFVTIIPAEEVAPLLRRAAQTGVASPAQEGLLRIPPLPPPMSPAPATDATLGPQIEAAAPPPPPPPIAETWTKTLSQTNTAQGRALEARLLRTDLQSLIETAPEQIPAMTIPILAEAALWVGDIRLAKALEVRSPIPLSPRLQLVLAMLDPMSGDRPVQRHIEAATNPSSQRQAIRDALIAWSAGTPTRGGLAALVHPGLPDIKGGQAGMRTALTLAAERGSKGEVALLVGLALQGQEPASADAETVAIAVRALRRVGLSTQAVDLAREYLLALDMAVPTRAAPTTTPAVNAATSKPNPASAASPSGLRTSAPATSQPKNLTPVLTAQPNQPKPAPSPRTLPPAPAPKAKTKAPSKPNWTPPK
ncbi:hypothetical protein MCEMIH15_00072 [Caulobacteraceae bacterium]